MYDHWKFVSVQLTCIGSIRGSLKGRSLFSSTTASFTTFSLPLFLINQEAKAIDRSSTANETRTQIGDGCLRNSLNIFVKLQATSVEIIRPGDKRLINLDVLSLVLLLNRFLFTRANVLSIKIHVKLNAVVTKMGQRSMKMQITYWSVFNFSNRCLQMSLQSWSFWIAA